MSGRFDWYQATVEADELGPLMQALEGAADGRPVWEDLPKAPHGYGRARRLNDMDGAVCMLWWGGSHELPHVVSSGESAQLVAQVLRGSYADAHRVTRCDACIDFAEPGAYERLEELALGVAGELRVSVGTAGDHLLTKQGRTLYLGAPSSHTRLRLYEKADELRTKFRGDERRLAEVPDELARLECQVRPQTLDARRVAARSDPLAVMGSTKWMRVLMRRVAGLELEPFEAGKPWRIADDDRAYTALLAQYGGLLQRICGDLGSWDMVGRQIGEDLRERAALRRKRGGA